MKINTTLQPADLRRKIEHFWERSAVAIRSLEASYQPENGAPVFTVAGRYTAQGWTEWTQGFQFGSALLQFDATDDAAFLDIGRDRTVTLMAPHLTHIGVHDHGFNNVSTYGALWRLMNEGRIPEDPWARHYYELALKCSGAVQASRWTTLGPERGFIHSFNGAHSLFADTIRSLRSLALGHRLGHVLMGENDARISLLARLIQHAATTAEYIVYYGEGRDHYDVRGRVVHEAIFNVRDGQFRCPSTQQGYTPFSTWTRGLAWIICGYPEELEFLDTVPAAEFESCGGKDAVLAMMRQAAAAACDFYIEQMPLDGVPYWDTGAPGLVRLGDYLDRPADPFNAHEPVDSSAGAIAAQGLLRFGRYLQQHREPEGARYVQAGLTVLDALFDAPYINEDDQHQGLLLHTIYHRPRGWDHIPAGSAIPHGESCMWGDYHAREAALQVQRLWEDAPYYTFFSDPRHIQGKETL